MQADNADQPPSGLLGDWGGIKPVLAQTGIATSLLIDNDLFVNTRGGARSGGVNLGLVDWVVKVDTERAGLWQGGFLMLDLIATYGGSPSQYGGDIQGQDNIEAFSTAKVFGLWYEQQLYDGRLAVLFGLHDFNSEFEVANFALDLINPSFGISPDISQVQPSIYSTTAPAIRLEFKPAADSYLLAAAYDGVPGNPGHPAGTRIDISKNDGIFWAAETGLSPSDEDPAGYYKAAAGVWYLDRNFEDFAGTERSFNRGIYAIIENTLFSEKIDSLQRLGYFVQTGWAEADRNSFDKYFGVGLSYVGLIPGRDRDAASAGWAQVSTSGRSRQLDPGLCASASVVEVTYKAQVTKAISVQPDLMWIHNPAGVSSLKDSLALILRIEAEL